MAPFNPGSYIDTRQIQYSRFLAASTKLPAFATFAANALMARAPFDPGNYRDLFKDSSYISLLVKPTIIINNGDAYVVDYVLYSSGTADYALYSSGAADYCPHDAYSEDNI
jgi:hypothetical protein